MRIYFCSSGCNRGAADTFEQNQIIWVHSPDKAAYVGVLSPQLLEWLFRLILSSKVRILGTRSLLSIKLTRSEHGKYIH